MEKLLVLFHSRYGQSFKIAEHVAAAARARGLAASLRPLDLLRSSSIPEGGGVVLVAPVYLGRHARPVRKLVAERGHLLASVPFAFVSVSNSAASRDPVVRTEASQTAREFMARAGLSPRVVITAGGALAYPRYGFITRFVMKRLAAKMGEPTDTSRVHELTDWVALDEEIGPFLDIVAGPSRAAAPRAAVGSGVFAVSTPSPARAVAMAVAPAVVLDDAERVAR